MKRKEKRMLLAGGALLFAFAIWTVLVRIVDVRAIGPRESCVGFAALNGFVHRLTGVHMGLYTVTDWLGLVPIFVAMGFALLGLVQWIQRKSLARVDRSLLVLGGFYIAVMAVYFFFEAVVINYRPVLISGYLEASYPSSTTLLVMCVMGAAIPQLNARIKNGVLRRCTLFAIGAFIAFMVLGRILSGVHWITDIIGGALVSAGLLSVYAAAAGLQK